MPYLFCDAHGHDHEATAKASAEHYRQAGESVLIVKGRLISGPWLCDRCNAELKRGGRACLAFAFPAWLIERTPVYDFSYEGQFFDMKQAEVTFYGAAWPAIAARPSGLASAASRGNLTRRSITT